MIKTGTNKQKKTKNIVKINFLQLKIEKTSKTRVNSQSIVELYI